MRKRAMTWVVLTVVLVGFVGSAQGAWEGVKGAAGVVTSEHPLGLFFYASAGESYDIISYAPPGMGLFCGITSIDYRNVVLAYGDRFHFRAPLSTLYLALCIQAYGYSEDLSLVGAFPSYYGMMRYQQSEQAEPSAHNEAELKERLAQEFLKILGP
ncbi:hypothetical protein [Desulfosoma sp.]|uniref:hypothetical protein n=1 Tax=Desulfosoma sp. TaxID=2603217 RepID=UPI00404A5FD7